MRFPIAPGKSSRFFWIFMVIIGLTVTMTIWLFIRTTWGAKTLSYAITPENVSITFGPDDIHIDTASITDVYVIEQPTKAVRHMGTNIPGLKEGRWSFAETGSIRLYASTTEQLVVIETETQKWGISPQDPQSFLLALAQGQKGSFPPHTMPNTAALTAVGIMLGVVVFIMVFIVYYIIRLTRTAHYELTEDALLIHGGLRPTVIPLRHITAVEEIEPKGIPLRRIGIGMPGLHWGSFSWRAVGPHLKMYATRLSPLVVLRSQKATWAITPHDSAAFLDQVRKYVSTDDEK